MKKNWDLIKIVSSLIKTKQFSDAEKLLIQEIAANNRTTILLNKLADIYIRTGRLKDAENIINESLAIDPLNCYTLQQKGDLLAAKKNYPAAFEIFNDLIRGNPHDYYLVKRMARLYYLNGDYNKAGAYVDKAILIDAGRADIYHLQYQIFIKTEEYRNAESAINQALELEPGNQYYNREKMSLRVREKGLDSEDIRDAIKLTNNNDPQMLKLLGEKLKEENNFPEAIEAYTKLLDIEDSEFNRKMLAYACYRNGEYDRAFQNFILLADQNFNDTIFLSSVTAAAKSKENKQALLERLMVLVKNPAYRKLWGKIKKLQNDLKVMDDEKDR